MLEIRYNIITNKLTGWWASSFGNWPQKLLNRPDELIVELDIPIPDKPLDAWLYDETTRSLTLNPDYSPPQEDTDMIRASKLLATSPQVITMPEIWELLRIFGRLHGISPPP